MIAAATGLRVRGRKFASVFSLICNCGLAGPGTACNCTMLGIAGRNFGASIGAAEFTSVCLGWVGRTGSEMIRCLGWNPSAPSLGSGFGASPRGEGFFFGSFHPTNGKSLIGPDQVNSVLSKAVYLRGFTGIRGNGSSKKKMCHSAVATMARRGIRPSTQLSLKKSSRARCIGRDTLQSKTAMLLPTPP